MKHVNLFFHLDNCVGTVTQLPMQRVLCIWLILADLGNYNFCEQIDTRKVLVTSLGPVFAICFISTVLTLQAHR